MTHPATRRAVLAFLTAIDLPVDIGIVHPPDENGRSRAWWQRRALTSPDVVQLLPRLGRENAAGAAIYVRAFVPAGMGDGDPSPGLVLIDDLSAAAVASLRGDGIEPTAAVETSPGNFQAWIRLPSNSLSNVAARWVARSLAQTYGGDPKAVAFAQPGRLPGFTNRKARHRRQDGSFPFVLLRSTSAPTFGENLQALVAGAAPWASTEVTQAPRPGGKAETPSAENGENQQGGEMDAAMTAQLDALREKVEAQISSHVAAGRRPAVASSKSEVDFALAAAALGAGYDHAAVSVYLALHRLDKYPGYAARTVKAALRHLQSPPSTERSP